MLLQLLTTLAQQKFPLSTIPAASSLNRWPPELLPIVLDGSVQRLMSPLLSLMMLDWTADGSYGKHREFLVGWVNRALTNLELWLADRDFVAAKEFTVADILMTHVLSAGIKDNGLIAPYSGTASYRGSVPCSARVEQDHRGVLRAGGGGIDRHPRPRRIQ